eukprot:9687597-Karenia_brevis.AAC.1
MEATYDSLLTSVGYIDQYLELVPGRSLNESGQWLVRIVEQYRDTVAEWGDTVFADKLKHDYPWVKVCDHESHETIHLHDRTDIVQYCLQLLDDERFSVYYANGIRSKLAENTRAGRDKIQEVDRFMSDITHKIRATEL